MLLKLWIIPDIGEIRWFTSSQVTYPPQRINRIIAYTFQKLSESLGSCGAWGLNYQNCVISTRQDRAWGAYDPERRGIIAKRQLRRLLLDCVPQAEKSQAWLQDVEDGEWTLNLCIYDISDDTQLYMDDMN